MHTLTLSLMTGLFICTLPSCNQTYLYIQTYKLIYDLIIIFATLSTCISEYIVLFLYSLQEKIHNITYIYLSS